MKDLPIKVCRLCSGDFRQKRHDQVFCGRRCRQTFHRRNEVRGATAVQLLIEWRKSRGASKKASLSDIAHMVDGWIAEDRK
jgi:hypothetical protein